MAGFALYRPLSISNMSLRGAAFVSCTQGGEGLISRFIRLRLGAGSS